MDYNLHHTAKAELQAGSCCPALPYPLCFQVEHRAMAQSRSLGEPEQGPPCQRKQSRATKETPRPDLLPGRIRSQPRHLEI